MVNFYIEKSNVMVSIKKDKEKYNIWINNIKNMNDNLSFEDFFCNYKTV